MILRAARPPPDQQLARGNDQVPCLQRRCRSALDGRKDRIECDGTVRGREHDIRLAFDGDAEQARRPVGGGRSTASAKARACGAAARRSPGRKADDFERSGWRAMTSSACVPIEPGRAQNRDAFTAITTGTARIPRTCSVAKNAMPPKRYESNRSRTPPCPNHRARIFYAGIAFESRFDQIAGLRGDARNSPARPLATTPCAVAEPASRRWR